MKVLVVDGLQALEEHLLIGRNIRVKFVTCGRENCRCRLGERHGPYYYVRKKIGKKYKDIYVNVPKELPSLRYEAVGSSIILHISSLEEIPDFLKDYPKFFIRGSIINRPGE